MSKSRAVELGNFKNALSNPATAPFKPDEIPIFSFNQFLNNDLVFSPVIETSGTADGLTAARLKSSEKKKAKSKTLSGRLSKKPRGKTLRAPMFPFVTIKLIRPGKQKVRVPVNAVESTSSKRMHQSSLN